MMSGACAGRPRSSGPGTFGVGGAPIAFAASLLFLVGCPDDDAELEAERGDSAEEEGEAERQESAADPDPHTEESDEPPLPEERELPDEAGEHAGELAWVKGFGGLETDAARDVAPLAGGAVIAGYVADEVEIGDASHEAEEVDAYVARLDESGEVAWARFLTGEGEDIANGVAITEAGNIAVAGAFAHDLHIGDDAIAGAGGDNIFVAKFSPDGDRLWARAFGGDDIDAAHAISTGPGGRIYVTGVFRDEVEFGDHGLESPGDASIFALALSSEGGPIWARGFGGEGPDYGRAIAPHPRGVALLGEFSREVDFGETRLEAVANRDVVLALLDPAGEPLWAQGYGGVYNNVGVDLAVDPAGDVVATGSFDDEVEFGADTYEAEGQSDAFLIKVDGDGELVWSERVGSEREDMGTGVAVDEGGRIAAAGWFWQRVTLGGVELESDDRRSGYAAVLTAEGEPLWAQSLGGAYGDMARAVAFGDDGRVYVAGTFHRTARFGDEMLEAATERAGADIPRGDAFIAAFDP